MNRRISTLVLSSLVALSFTAIASQSADAKRAKTPMELYQQEVRYMQKMGLGAYIQPPATGYGGYNPYGGYYGGGYGYNPYGVNTGYNPYTYGGGVPINGWF